MRGGPGGPGFGILVRDSAGSLLARNTVDRIDGGEGGEQGYDFCQNPQGGVGGPSVGLEVEASADVELAGNTLSSTTGGLGGPDPAYCGGQRRGARGPARGLSLDGTRGLTAGGELIRDVAGSSVWGLWLGGDSARVTVANVTIYAVRGDAAATSVEILAGSTLDLRSSLVVGSSHRGVVGGNAAHVDDVAVTYSLVSGVAQEADRLLNVEADDTVLEGDPEFLDPPDDLRLDDASPAIDAGDPEAACDQEPQSPGGGCRIDMGHLGNTERARAFAVPLEP